MSTLERFQNYIAGKFVDADGGRTFDSLDPYAGEPWAAIPEGTVAVYEPGDAEAMAAAIFALADDPLDREAAVALMRDVVRDAAWEREAERYVAIVERLASS